MEKESKNFRTLGMYVRLCEGKTMNKAEGAPRFSVDERSIQRDIDDIRAFLDERSMSGDGRTIEYDRTQKGFVMVGDCFLQDLFAEHKDKDSTFGKIYEKTLQTHLTIFL